MPRQKEDD